MHLKCKFGIHKSLNNKYCCTVTEANIRVPGVSVVVTGRHFFDNNNYDVEIIEFKNTIVHFFPRNLHKVFPRLKVLMINACGLKEINHEDLEGLEELTTLNLYHNALVTLPDNLFSKMKSLKRISFWHNKLGRFTSEVLAPLIQNDVDYVEFRDNTTINSFYSKEGGPDSLGNIEDLMEVIDLSGPESFSPKMVDDNLEVPPCDELMETDYLQSPASLAPLGNEEIEVPSFKILSETEDFLNIVNQSEVTCEFQDIEWRDNLGLYTCQVISVDILRRGTVIQMISGDHLMGKDDSTVRAMVFNQKKVQFFPRGINEIFKNLVALDMEECELKIITRNDLKGLENLVQFYVGKNRLTKLPDDLLVGMSKLTMISFNGNQIKQMSSKLLKNIPVKQLVYVDFRGNASIDALFEPGRRISVDSIDKLMEIIDKTCINSSGNDKFIEKLEEIYELKKFTDFTIIADDEQEFKVHKIILASHSSVFASHFEDSPSSKNMKISGFSSGAVEIFLQFIYSRKCQIEVKRSEVLELAEKFDMMELEDMIKDNLENRNACIKIQEKSSNEIKNMEKAPKTKPAKKTTKAKPEKTQPEMVSKVVMKRVRKRKNSEN